jgi:trehalose 6-phosphate phosphatase
MDIQDSVREANVSAGSRSSARLPSALTQMEEIRGRIKGRRLAVFLDYDGTLTPIVARPDLAVLSGEMRKAVADLAGLCTVAVISGRDLRDVRSLVGIEDIFYAGSHGFEIAGPEGRNIGHQAGQEFIPDLDAAERWLRERLAAVPGCMLERKRFSIAVHYRQVEKRDLDSVGEIVHGVLEDHPRLRNSHGKKVYDLQPGIDWHKGRAVVWLLEALGLDLREVMPVYIGDDITDEDAFTALAGLGICVLVRNGPRPTAAEYALENSEDVRRFLRSIASVLGERGKGS